MTLPVTPSRASPFAAAAITAAGVTMGAALALGSPLPQDARSSLSAAALVVAGGALVFSGLRAARASGPRRRRAWLLLVAAALTAMVGNLVGVLLGADPVSAPSVPSEALIALGLALSVYGLVSLQSGQYRGPARVLLVLDGLVMAGGVLVITSVIVYSEVLETMQGSLGHRLLTLLFPLLDVVLVTVALLLVVQSRHERVFLSLAGLGFLLYAVADLTFAVQAAQDDFAFGGLHDVGWIAGYALLVVAAWHPDASREAGPDEAASVAPVQRTVLVFGVLLLALVVQLFYPDETPLSRTQMLLWLALVLAVGARQTLLTADNAALRQGLERRVAEQTADIRRLARETEALLQSVGDGIYGVDREGRLTFTNPSAAASLGYAADALLGAEACPAFHSPHEPVEGDRPGPCYLLAAIRDGDLVTEEDVYVRADGSTFPVEITASPLADERGILGAVVAFRDVTQRHEVERMKNEFLSVVSHELRTPLTSIRGSLGLLASGALVELTPQAQRMLTIATESSDRLTRLINDILDIERIESGRLPMTFAPQEAADLVDACVQELGALADAHGVRLAVGELTGRVMADRDRIVQTLTNLVGNAIKFSPPQGVVHLTAGPRERWRGTVVFTVRDEGRGIPQEKLESIFQPFEQVDSSDAREQGGTGLGLAISRGIVEGHGGRIWADSRVGEGTAIHFTVPVASEAERGGGEEATGGAPVVLVCDDDDAAVTTVCGLLSARGFRAVGVTTADEARELATRDRPAAILVDLLMPGTSGAELVDQLRADERTRPIPVVVVSGMAPDADPDLARTAEEWLVKPTEEEELVATVTRVLAGRRERQRVLVVEDDRDLAAVLAALLESHGLHVEHETTVAGAVACAEELRPSVIVLDLDLPDGGGEEVIERLRDRDGALGDTSVVVYTAGDVSPERGTQFAGIETIVLTKARTGPADLEDRVLRLMEAMTGLGGAR